MAICRQQPSVSDTMQCRWPLKPLDSTICIRPHSVCGAFRKEIEHLPSLQVHDDGPVSGALAPSPNCLWFASGLWRPGKAAAPQVSLSARTRRRSAHDSSRAGDTTAVGVDRVLLDFSGADLVDRRTVRNLQIIILDSKAQGADFFSLVRVSGCACKRGSRRYASFWLCKGHYPG